MWPQGRQKQDGSKPRRRSFWSRLFKGRRSAQRREVASRRISTIQASDRDPILSSNPADNHLEDFSRQERRQGVWHGGMFFQQFSAEPIRITSSSDLKSEEFGDNTGAQTWEGLVLPSGSSGPSRWGERTEPILGVPTIRLPTTQPGSNLTRATLSSNTAKPSMFSTIKRKPVPSTYYRRQSRSVTSSPISQTAANSSGRISNIDLDPSPSISESARIDLSRLSLGWASRHGSSRASIESNDSNSDVGIQSDFEWLSTDDLSDAGGDTLSTSFISDRLSDIQSSVPSIFAINHNMRYLEMADPPAWYILDPPRNELGDPAYLCGTCRRIDFTTLLNQEPVTETPPKDAMIRLGSLREVFFKFKECGFCRLVTRILSLYTGRKALSPNSTMLEMASYFIGEYLPYHLSETIYLYPCRFHSRYNERILYLGRGDYRRDSIINSASFFRPDPGLAMRQVHECCQAPNMGRLIDQEHFDTINYSWICEQMALCDERDVGAPNSLPIDIEVIDVQQMRLVTRPRAADYITLSYVWGDGPKFKHMNNNTKLLHRHGGIAQCMDQIPQTIKDAMTLTHQIGQRYLWVDALCIKQEDTSEKARQLAQMGKIYKASILTVVARSGKDASDGLRGVIPGTRRVCQVSARVGNNIMSNVLPLESDSSSVWKTRAWTMQEDSLARRRLYISEDGCYFWCWHSTTPEDAFCRHKWWRVGESHTSMALFYQGQHDAIVKRQQDSMLDIYAWVVAEYTARDMSYPEDAENAIMGVLSVVQSLLSSGFVGALPRSHLNSALLWYPIGASCRRTNKDQMPLFPSWSWLGWCGQAAYPWIVERNYELSRLSGIWGADMQVVYTPYPCCDPTKNPRQLKLHVFSASLALSGVPLQRAEKYNFEHAVYYEHVLDSRGFYAGCIFIPDPAHLTEQQEEHFLKEGSRFEFIALSRASVDSGSSDNGIEEQKSSMEYLTEDLRQRVYSQPLHFYSDREALTDIAYNGSFVHQMGQFNTLLYDGEIPYCLVNVMMIKWDEMGRTASRVAVGRIHVDAFCQAGAVEKYVILE